MPGIKERAKGIVSAFRRLLGSSDASVMIRDGVALVFLHEDPRIDFAEHRLVEAVQDDQLIASMLQFRSQDDGASEIVVVTDDFLLLRKARAAGLASLCLPDELRLAEVPSAEQKRLKQLEDENRRLLNRMPQLQLLFEDRARRSTHRLPPTPSWNEDLKAQRLEAYKRQHPLRGVPERIAYPVIRKSESSLGFELAPGQSFEHPLAAGARLYDQELESHYREYAAYLDRRADHLAWVARSLPVSFVLVNEGTAAATDIDIHVQTGAGVQAFLQKSGEDALRGPKPPKLPEPEDRFGLIGTMALERPIGALPSIPTMWEPSYEIEERQPGVAIHMHVPKLKHGTSELLGPFVLVYGRQAEVCSFRLDYVINSETLLEEQRGTLHVEVSQE